MWLVPGCPSNSWQQCLCGLRLSLTIAFPGREWVWPFGPRTQHPRLRRLRSGVTPVHAWERNSPWLLERMKCVPDPQLDQPCLAFTRRAAHGQRYVRVAVIYEGWGSVLHCLQGGICFFHFCCVSVAFCFLCFLKALPWALETATLICDVGAEGALGKLWPVSRVLGNVLQVTMLSNTCAVQGGGRTLPHETRGGLTRLFLVDVGEYCIEQDCWAWALHFPLLFSLTAESKFAISVT